jgi:hypothetical protein
MFTDLSGTQIIDNYTFLDGFPNFVIRTGGNLVPGGLTWGNLGYCYTQTSPLGGDCNGIVMNGVRYDTPVFKGFSASASWGEDDFWEAAGRYAGEVAGFKLAFGAGYAEFTSERTSGTVNIGGAVPVTLVHKDTSNFQAGGYAQHLATGLFVHAAYGSEDNSGTVLSAGGALRAPLDSHHWYVKAGVRQKWMPFGATIVYGDYAEYTDQVGPAALALGIASSSLEVYGGGIAQEIDAAAMTMYLKYQRYEADVTGAPLLGNLADVDFLSAGALINF